MPNRRGVVAALAVAAVAGGAVAAGVFLTRGPDTTPATSSATPTPSQSPLGEGAGFEEVSPTPTASIGPDPYEGQDVATDPPVVATGEQVDVTVTFTGWNSTAGEVQVGGYVAGVVEDGGTCTLTLTKDGQSVTGSRPAAPDAATTACGAVVVPGDRVSAGTWQAVLTYSSAAHSGSSEAWDVEVPQ